MDEILRLLESEGIQMQYVQTQMSAEERTKGMRYIKNERRKKDSYVKRWQNIRPPVLCLPAVGNKPKRVRLCVYQKDVSFLSRGEPAIWHHFSIEIPYLKERRHRLDHGDVVFTSRIHNQNGVLKSKTKSAL